MTLPDRVPPIGAYGMISDCNTASLVGPNGSIDWLCLPRYDSRSIFARILDPRAGHWSIQPANPYRARRRYIPGTLVLETTFATPDGEVRLTDALGFALRQRGHDLGLAPPHEVIRLVEGISGTVELEVEIVLRPEYGLSHPLLVAVDDGVRTSGGPDSIGLSSSIPLRIDVDVMRANFKLAAGDGVGFALRWGPPEAGAAAPSPPNRVKDLIADTVEGWRSWDSDHDIYNGRYRHIVRLSSRILKGLSYRPTGAIVAAPTTSLPESIGGERNWDYRYSWIRDASLTLEALWIGACSDEVGRFVSWMVGAAGGHVHVDAPLQIMYGITGERDLSERELPHLRGWRSSRPVRVGNGAWTQTQLDVYGEFLNALALYADRLGELDEVTQHFIRDLANAAARYWREPDAGIWEMRAEPRHHLSSKLMCWVAMDRAIRLAPRIGAEEEVDRWGRERESIRRLILDKGWSEKRRAFVQSLQSEELDASVLLMPIVGFLPATDARMLSTIEAIEGNLTENGLVHRYRSQDGLPGQEGTFAICSFWLVSCLAKAGMLQKAQQLFDRLVGYTNDLGLLAEEIDPNTGELLGNFPQAFSHIGLIIAAAEIHEALEQSADRTGLHGLRRDELF